MKSLVLAVSLILVPGASFAVSSFYSGGDLFEQCGEALEASAGAEAKQSHCFGYVAGVLDGIAVTLDSLVVSAEYLCVPKGLITAEDVASIFFDYLSSHPQHREAAASSLVLVSLREAFPCGDQRKRENLEKHMRGRLQVGEPVFSPRGQDQDNNDGP